ncbi:hypothetical protein B0H63DRAFT_38222 [Podospora didyma]|uniref:Extracellular serine-rich protein n=1 Tax=Podospora didyma TaxID=330526 RepID=A0AAE0U7S9_9PEZI|nr:hypothetical protein B0H63DRAFT_38222 [Podospora didyma]
MLALHFLGLMAALRTAGVVAQYSTSTTLHSSTTEAPKTTSAPSATTTTGSTSSTAAPKTIAIAVGANGFSFEPKQVNASVGDTIRFNFYPGAHRVSRAEYKFPCIPYEYTGANKVGFWSGIIAPQVISNPPPSYDVKINDTNPVFYYCSAPESCTKEYMIGVINPSNDQTLDTQLRFAKNATFQLSPGDPFPSEGSIPTLSPTGPGGSAATSQPAAGASVSDHPHLSAGAIAGIAVGAVVVLGLLAFLIFLCGRRGGFYEAYRKSRPATAPPFIPGMIETKYYNNGNDDPKSPGNASLSTYSPHDVHDPFHHGSAMVHNNMGPLPLHFGSAPISPTYAPYQAPFFSGSPPLHNGLVREMNAYPNEPLYRSPVELPTAATSPGVAELSRSPVARSPPPVYPRNSERDSWTAGPKP